MMWDLQELLRITDATVIRWPGVQQVQPVLYPGRGAEGGIFFATSLWEAGEPMYETAVKVGAAGVVVQAGQPLPDAERYPQLGVLEMEKPMAGYLALGREARRRSQALVIGVTGTSGKSSTKEFIAQLLQERYTVHATHNSRNMAASCAKILLGMTGAADEAAVIEMGFGALGDIERMASMALPYAGVITKVTPAHLNGARGSMEGVAREKGRMGLHVPPHGFMVLNADDSGSKFVPSQDYRCRIYTFGTTSSADAWYEDVVVTEEGTRFTLCLAGQRLACRLKACAAPQAANATAAALVALLLGMSPGEIADKLSEVTPLARRFDVYRFSQGLTIIDDTFNSNFDAACRGLESAARLGERRRRVAVVTGLARLLDKTQEVHRQLGRQVAACGFGHLVLVGDDERIEFLRDGALEGGLSIEHIHFVREKKELPAQLMEMVKPDTLFYMKGRQGMMMGDQVDRLRRAVVKAGYTAVKS